MGVNSDVVQWRRFVLRATISCMFTTLPLLTQRETLIPSRKHAKMKTQASCLLPDTPYLHVQNPKFSLLSTYSHLHRLTLGTITPFTPREEVWSASDLVTWTTVMPF